MLTASSSSLPRMSLDNANWKQTGHHANDVNIQAHKHVYLVAGANGGIQTFRSGGEGHLDPENRGGGLTKFFSAL